MSIAEALGYLASGLVVVTFCMKTMTPLRVVAIASHLAFIAYSIAERAKDVRLQPSAPAMASYWR